MSPNRSHPVPTFNILCGHVLSYLQNNKETELDIPHACPLFLSHSLSLPQLITDFSL